MSAVLLLICPLSLVKVEKSAKKSVLTSEGGKNLPIVSVRHRRTSLESRCIRDSGLVGGRINSISAVVGYGCYICRCRCSPAHDNDAQRCFQHDNNGQRLSPCARFLFWGNRGSVEPLRSAISNGAFGLGRALLYSAWLHKGLIVALLDCLWSVAHLLGV